MALEIMSGAVNNIKINQPAEPAREVRTTEQHADVQKASTSVQIEKQVVAGTEQDGVSADARNQQQEDAARIQAAVKRANNLSHRTSCRFAYDENTKRVSITVLDDVTNEVVREIPSEEALELVQRMWEMAGLMVDEAR